MRDLQFGTWQPYFFRLKTYGAWDLTKPWEGPATVGHKGPVFFGRPGRPGWVLGGKARLSDAVGLVEFHTYWPRIIVFDMPKIWLNSEFTIPGNSENKRFAGIKESMNGDHVFDYEMGGKT